jgi:hypothetical protein
VGTSVFSGVGLDLLVTEMIVPAMVLAPKPRMISRTRWIHGAGLSIWGDLYWELVLALWRGAVFVAICYSMLINSLFVLVLCGTSQDTIYFRSQLPAPPSPLFPK